MVGGSSDSIKAANAAHQSLKLPLCECGHVRLAVRSYTTGLLSRHVRRRLAGVAENP